MKYLTVCLGALLAIGLAVAATPASAGEFVRNNDCFKCPPLPRFDTTEVMKNAKEIDHSKVIETESVVPSKRLIETNHLVIHENEIRNVGTIQHNHTIIEKELVLRKQNVFHKNVNTEVNLVENKFNTERKHVVEEREIPGREVFLKECNCERRESPLHSFGMAQAADAYGSAPRYVKSRY
jgi:hypothetical protein